MWRAIWWSYRRVRHHACTGWSGIERGSHSRLQSQDCTRYRGNEAIRKAAYCWGGGHLGLGSKGCFSCRGAWEGTACFSPPSAYSKFGNMQSLRMLLFVVSGTSKERHWSPTALKIAAWAAKRKGCLGGGEKEEDSRSGADSFLGSTGEAFHAIRHLCKMYAFGPQ